MNIAHIASKIVQRPIAELIPRKDNPRTHNAKQLKTVVDSIRRFGFTNPILIGADGTLVAGHARLEAARKLGMTSVPTITLGHLTPAELKAYVIADNRTAELAGWDRQLLALNLIEIEQLDPDFDLTLTGFDDFAIELL
jgi:ParB-like chromosome segregation protein Spo0J